MKTFISFILVIPAFASASDWQGTWEKPPGSSLTIRHCKDSQCDYMLRTAQKIDAGCSQMGRASLKGETASLTPSGSLKDEPYTPNSYGCVVTATLKEDVLRLQPFSKACQNYCLTGSPTSSPYKLVSPQPFADNSKCFTDKSRARRVWCTDESFQQRENLLADLEIEAADADPKSLDSLDKTFPDSAIQACESEPAKCLRAKYDEREKLLNRIVANATSVHKKRIKDLQTPGDSKKAAALIGKLAGVYKEQFQNALVTGEEYKSENILEVVPVTDTSIYFKTFLAFYNGHQCNAFGLAKYSVTGEFVSVKDGCTITITADAEQIKLDDEGGTCKDQCGARGSLSHVSFPLSKKRVIKYMDRLKKSEDYLQSTKP